MVENSARQARSETQKGIGAFPIKLLKFVLWAALITGIIAAVVNLVLALVWPDRAQLNLPIGVLWSSNSRSGISNRILAITYENQTPPLFEYTSGQYNIPFSRLPRIDRYILMTSQSLLALAWSCGAWFLLSIVQSLPKPFTLANTRRVTNLGWLSLGINIGNSLLGGYFSLRLLDDLKAHMLPWPPNAAKNLTFTFFSSPLAPTLFIPWSVVLGAFALALVFRIGVQHREHEQMLEAEQELTV